MLYSTCKRYLADKLKEAGLSSKPIMTRKSLESCPDSSLGAVLFESETISRNGSKTQYKDQEGARIERKKVFDRILTFTVVIGGYTDEEAETLFERFIGCLEQGIYVDGNFVPIGIDRAEWSDSDDSLLRAKVAVQTGITFSGGYYQDTGFIRLRSVEVESIEKSNGKEP